tara:strand:+ start:1260 stop:1562 length:303 start_codon:yes stop_codon:yes gene_type:complete
MSCIECSGKGYVIEPDNHHDCMIKKECMSCMLDDNYREHLSFEMTKLLSGLSNQKLAQTMASMVVNHSKYINNPQDWLETVATCLQNKNIVGLFALSGGI